MIDENAFGILLCYFDVEEDEYSTENTREFVEQFQSFKDLSLSLLDEAGLPEKRRSICFGHSVYTEFQDDEDSPQLFAAVRRAAARLLNYGFENIVVLSHGSRWVEEQTGEPPEVVQKSQGLAEVVHFSPPSEPLRRALNAESMARPDDELGGWGAGVYVDTEAIEALGKQPKNAPTQLRACGATFYRIPPLVLPPESSS